MTQQVLQQFRVTGYLLDWIMKLLSLSSQPTLLCKAGSGTLHTSFLLCQGFCGGLNPDRQLEGGWGREKGLHLPACFLFLSSYPSNSLPRQLVPTVSVFFPLHPSETPAALATAPSPKAEVPGPQGPFSKFLGSDYPKCDLFPLSA